MLRFGERKTKRDGGGRGLIIAIKKNHTGWIKSKEDNEQAQKLTAEVYLDNNKRIYITNIYRKQINRRTEDGVKFW